MEFYILINNVKQGPFPLDALASKNITPNTMVWTVGFTDWKPAKQVPELSDLLACLPPEPPLANKNIMPKTWLLESILVTCLFAYPLVSWELSMQLK